MSIVRAKLSVLLKADEVVVAETEDAVLWQKVLAAINGGSELLLNPPNPAAASHTPTPTPAAASPTPAAFAGTAMVSNEPLARFAAQIGAEVDAVEGAFSPSDVAPYLHLDSHCWEAMKDQLPERGAAAIGPIALAGTVLALWLRSSSQTAATQALAQDVLGTIGLRDPNASRTVGRVPWLQTRAGGQLLINPASISRASLLARCFATKDWAAWKAAS